MHRTLASALLAAGLLANSAAKAAPDEQLARELLADLVGINTAPSGGPDLRPAVDLLVGKLREAGFEDADISTEGVSQTLPNLVVRLRSPAPTAGPVLLMAHLDVVEGLESDWTYPPYQLTEDDGWLYGRGTTDNKAGAAILIANFIRLKQEGFVPNRDLIVMLAADEESTGASADFLALQRRELIDADFALNTDGGSVILGPDDKPLGFVLQTAEKVYAAYTLTATDPGGHSSVPTLDSAISRLARTLVTLENEHFPIDLNETSRGFFAAYGPLAPAEEQPLFAALAAYGEGSAEPEGLGLYPYYNSIARTTCVATMLSGGHAENALPQTATAVVNCRIVPQQSAAEVEARLAEMAAPNGVSVASTFAIVESPPSPLREDVVGPVSAEAAKIWPGVPVIPEMSTGATDGAYLRRAGIPVYGVGAIAERPDELRAHGQDERIKISAYNDALAYWYALTKAVAQ